MTAQKAEPAKAELGRLMQHRLFRKSQTLQRFLAYLVDAELAGRAVSESELASDVLGLAEHEFHPYTNSIIRVNISSLRKRLDEYYREVPPSLVRFQLPRGAFRVRIDEAGAPLENWRRAFGQAKILAASRYVDELQSALRRIDDTLAARPKFAPGYALRSRTHLFIGSHGGAPRESARLAREAAERAIELAPDAWDSLAAAASVASLVDWDWQRADSLYDHALNVPGNEVVADPWWQATEVALDRIGPCLGKVHQALSSDSVSHRSLQQNYGIMLHLARRWDEAEIELAETTELYPDDYCPWLWRAMQELLFSNSARAAYSIGQSLIVTRGRLPGTIFQSLRDLLVSGKFELPVSEPGGAEEAPKVIASRWLNRPEHAIDALERMLEARNALTPIFLRAPINDYLCGSARFLALFDRMGIPPPAGS